MNIFLIFHYIMRDIIYVRPAVSASRSLVAVDDKGTCFFYNIWFFNF